MNCEDVRLRLAAYRRNEWTAAEQHAVREHLVGCAACRRWEAEARGVGEHLRQMPTIIPPASLRDNVFAAIRREELAAATKAAETAKPALPPTPRPLEVKPPRPAAPVLLPRSIARTRPFAAKGERLGEVMVGAIRPPRVIFGRTTAIATIAALFLIMFTARFVPFNTLSLPGVIYNITGPQIPITTLVADPRFPKVTSTFADNNQIFYVGQAPNKQQMLFAYNRSSSQTIELLAQPTSDKLTLLALSDQMLVWETRTSSGWTLQAAPMVDGLVQPFSATMPLLAYSGQSFGNSVLAKFNTVWANGPSVLFIATDTKGMTLLERVDYTNNEPLTYTFLAEAQAGHQLTLPYLDGQTAYWVDEQTMSDGTPQGTLWRKDDLQPAAALGITANAFGPVAAQGAVAWFQVNASQTTGESSAIMHSLAGAVQWQTAANAAPQTISALPVSATNVWRGDGYLMWRDALGLHVLRVDSGARSDSNNLPTLGAFDALGLSPTSMAWVATPAVNAAAAPSVISVFQIPG